MAKKEKSEAAEKIVKAEKTKAKKPKVEKPNIFIRMWSAIKRFFKDLRGETKKIVWPDGKTVLKSTGVVLAAIVVFTIIIWLIDTGLSTSINMLSKVAKNDDEAVTETVNTTAATTQAALENIVETQAETQAQTQAETAAETAAAEAVTE